MPQHITQLVRLDNLCKEWSSIHGRSCELFSSLVNILTQRDATANLLRNSHLTSQSPASRRLITNTNLLSSLNPIDQVFTPRTLELVIYKQSQEVEKVLTKIHNILDEFEEVLKLMKNISSQSHKILLTINTPKFTNPTGQDTVNPSTATTKKKSKKKNKSSSSNKLKSPPQTKREPRKVDGVCNDDDDGVVDISIPHSNFYISDIVQMYEKELTHKRNLLFGGALKIGHPEKIDNDDNDNNGNNNINEIGDIVDVVRNIEAKEDLESGTDGVKLVCERWAKQPFINFEIEEEMVDRIKIWKRFKES